MKKILLALLNISLVFTAHKAVAQAPFTMASTSDTIYCTVNSSGLVPGATDFITSNIPPSTAPGGLPLKWRVISSNFPADWLGQNTLGICDNNVCRYNIGDTAIWNATTASGPQFTSAPYLYDSSMTFYLSLNLSGASAGTHYMTVMLTDANVSPNYTKPITFIISNATAGVGTVNKADETLLYPNPAGNELNIVYDASLDVKNIAVYNIIGRMMNVYKVTANNSANLDLSNLPSGIYFARLVNSRGQVIVTKKFTKQ